MWIEMWGAPNGIPKAGASAAHFLPFRPSYISPRDNRCGAYGRGKRARDRLVVRSVLIGRVVVVVHLHAVTNIYGFDPTEGVGPLRDRLELAPSVAGMRPLVSGIRGHRPMDPPNIRLTGDG